MTNKKKNFSEKISIEEINAKRFRVKTIELENNKDAVLTHYLDYKKITREDFMNFFRDDEKLNELTVDDRVEIFRYILLGSSDFSKKLLDEILSDYCVGNLEIIEI